MDMRPKQSANRGKQVSKVTSFLSGCNKGLLPFFTIRKWQNKALFCLLKRMFNFSLSTRTALNFDISFYLGARQHAMFKQPDYSEADFIIRKALTPSHPRNICLPPFLFNPKSQSSSSKNICLGNEKCTFFGR